MRIESTATDSYPHLEFKNDARTYGIYGAHGQLSDSFSIYDGTAGAHRLTISSSGNVGIGIASPSKPLHIYSASDTAIRLQNSTTGTGTTDGLLIEQSGLDSLIVNYEAGNLRFHTSNSERMRLDSSGNLLVGTTSSDSVNDGVRLKPYGQLAATANNDIPLYINRRSSDGDIAQFRRDNSVVGSIGSYFGAMYIGTPTGTDGYIRLGQAELVPATSTGANRDNYMDLGSSSARFKDLHLSGTGYFGTSVGIGTTSPSKTLEVNAGTNTEMRIGTTTNGSLQLGHFSNGTFIGTDSGTPSAADLVRLGTGGTERMRIDSSGRVGIGTNSPSSYSSNANNLVVGSGSGTEGITINSGSANYGTIYFADGTAGSAAYAGNINYNHADNSMRLGTNGSTTSVVINSSGNVGIGTTSPAAKLSIDGGTAGNYTDGISLQKSGGNVYGIYPSTNNLEFRSVTGGNHIATFDYFGKVGIGTDSPSVLIEGQTSTANSAYLRLGSTLSTSSHVVDSDIGALEFYSGDPSGAGSGVKGSIRYKYGSTSGATTHMTFHTAGLSSGNDTERMRIDSSGNVGIGTSSPSNKLVIAEGTNQHGIEFAPGTLSYIQAYDRATSDYGDLKIDAQTIRFGTDNGSERARLDASGNLLVGTTDTAHYGGSTNSGFLVAGNGLTAISRSAGTVLYLNRQTSDGDIVTFRKDGSTVGSIGTSNGYPYLQSQGSAGLTMFTYIQPRWNNAAADNAIDLGSGSFRFDDVFATNGTIQTSDRNEKQDIAELSDAEQRVAVAAKGLLRKFRWKSSVAEKGDEARTHFGIIAQDLQDAFTAEGLDAGDYAMFISSTWTDENGVEQTRLGVRYSELLAFIIAAI